MVQRSNRPPTLPYPHHTGGGRGTVICIQTYIHTYIQTYIHTYISTYLPAYLRSYVRTYGRTDVRTYGRTDVRMYVCTYVRTYVRTYLPTYLPPSIHPSIVNFQGHCSLQLFSLSTSIAFLCSNWSWAQGACIVHMHCDNNNQPQQSPITIL